MTTNNTLSQLKKGEKKKLYTYLNVGESIFDLYGFATQNELNSFKLLLGVSGVGPKAALAILSANTPEGLAMAIVTEDAKSLTAAQGIGKKIAQRIILELKDKWKETASSELGFLRRKGRGGPSPCLPARPRGCRGAGGAGLFHARGADGPQGCGCGESAVGGDHPPEPEENGEVIGK